VDENQPLRQLTVTSANPTVQQWVASDADSGRRLDAFLAAHLPDITRREIVEWIAAGHVRVNGRVSAKGSVVRSGSAVTLAAPRALLPNPQLPIQILWADDTIVVVNKPSGIPSVALRHDETDTVANFLLAHFPEMATAGPRMLEAGVVHRLDTATSGVLLAARTPDAYTALREQFTSQTVQKQYLALVHGHVSQPGTCRSKLRSTGPRGRHISETTGNGQEAQTDYVPVIHFPHHTLIRVTIPTGVRHQIRVHLAALGYPIVGDALYGKPQGEERLCLHAELLSLLHPQTGVRMQFTCPLPEDFQVGQERITSTRAIP
jgi:23S rRNA pseudouridine1911/1915/1917 synthase